MKIFLGLAILCIGWSPIFSQEYYPSIFDFVDIDTILENPRLRDQYTACLLDEGPCTVQGQTLRNLLPELIETNCSKCTKIQKKNSQKVLSFMKEKKPELWVKFVVKYDPEGQYLEKFEKNLKE